MPQNRKPLPALDNAATVKKPDLPSIYDRNYTDTILRYGGLATRFPQLETNAKTIVDAINELYSGGGGDGKHRTLTQYEYDQLTEEEKNDGTIYFITDAPSTVVRPEDLSPDNALPGQLLTFYNDYGDHGIWTATPLVRNPSNGDTILWSSQYGTWVNGSVDPGKSALSELTDVSLNNLSNNQVLKYNELSGLWENADESGGVTELSELSDVYISGYDDGDVLIYRSGYDAWTNQKVNIDDLGYVDISNICYAGQVLQYDGATWRNDTLNFADIEDVSIQSLGGSQVLMYNGNRDLWVNVDFNLSKLGDTNIDNSHLYSGQVLVYNGSSWVNSTDFRLDFNNLADGDILVYDGFEWVNVPKTEAISLDDLTNTEFTDLQNGQVLTYDSNSDTWVNASGGGGGASSLDDLSDVSIDTSTLTPGQFLYYDGDYWVNYAGFAIEIDEYVDDGNILVYDYGVWKNVSVSDAINLVDLADVNVDNLQDGEVLVYDSDSEKWVNASGGSATSLDNLSDVSITGPATGEILTYNGSEWFNSPLAVYVTQIQSTGTKIATITVDDVDTDLYAPTSGGSSSLTGLSDVNITSVSDGQVLKYDSSTSKWVNGTGGGGATTLSGLSDVTISSASSGQILKYDGTKWVNGDSDLIAEELTPAEYSVLPTADKLDPKVLHFINGNSSTVLDVSNYVTKYENSMTITADTGDNELVFAWNGGTNIGGSAVYSVAIPATISKIRFKITTGTSYSTSNDRFKVGIGIKSTYTPASFVAPNDNDWLAVKIFATNNSVFEDELDLSSISTNSYLYVCGHGWNMAVNSVVTETSSEETKLLYKDFNYTGSGGSSVSALDDLSDVDITSASSGDVLTYDGSDWVNDSISVSADDVSYDNTDSGLTATNVQDAIDEVSQLSIPWKDIIGTLEAGQTSITLTDISITSNSVIEIFTDSDVDYNSVTVSSGAVIVTFDEQPTNIQVMARITSVNASSITYNIDLYQYVTNKIWYRSDYQSSSSDTPLGINVQGSDSRNDWTSGATVCIDLNEFTIPASFTKMIIYISAWLATGHSGIFAVSHNTKYEATTSNTSDAILRDTRLAYPYIDSNYGTVSETDVVYEINCVPSNFGRYLYIYVGDGLAAEQISGYNNGYNGTYNATFAGIRFV